MAAEPKRIGLFGMFGTGNIGNDRLTRPTPVGGKSRVRLGKTVLELRK